MDWKQAASPPLHNGQSGYPVSDTSSTGRYSHKHTQKHIQTTGAPFLTYKLCYNIERRLCETVLRALEAANDSLGFLFKLQAYIQSWSTREDRYCGRHAGPSEALDLFHRMNECLVQNTKRKESS